MLCGLMSSMIDQEGRRMKLCRLEEHGGYKRASLV
jgi:hypothetical protein